MFQARTLCAPPPLEEDKLMDLIRMMDKRKEGAGEAANGAHLELEAHVGSLLVDRLRDRWIYLLPEEQWYEYKNNSWNSPPGWAYEILNRIEGEIQEIDAVFTRAQKRKMSSQTFLKAIEERLRRFLKQTRTDNGGSRSLTVFWFRGGQ